jgi:hypothetical protein
MDVTFHCQEPIRDSFNIPTNTMSVDRVFGTHVRPSQDRFPAFSFETEDMNRLVSSTGLLNDVCINGCAALLYTQFAPTPGHFTIFSMYDLHRIRYNADDETLWRNTSRTCYWETSVWILPIHRPASSHWVLCKIDFALKRVDLFDSFAERKPWKTEIKVWFLPCTKLIH